MNIPCAPVIAAKNAPREEWRIASKYGPAISEIASHIVKQFNNELLDPQLNHQLAASSKAFSMRISTIYEILNANDQSLVEQYLDNLGVDELINVSAISRAFRGDVVFVSRAIENRIMEEEIQELFFGKQKSEKVRVLNGKLERFILPTLILSDGVCSGYVYPPKSVLESRFINILDEAILGFSRIHPRRYICLGSQLVLENVQPFTTVITDQDINKCREVYDSMYEIASTQLGETYAVTFMPKFSSLDCSTFGLVYKTQASNFQSTKVYDVIMGQSEALDTDVNLGGYNILNKILGSTQASISTALEFLSFFGSEFFGGDIGRYRASFSQHDFEDFMMFVNVHDMCTYVKKNNVSVESLTAVHETIAQQLELTKHLLFNFNVRRSFLTGENLTPLNFQPDVIELPSKSPVSILDETDS